MKKKMPAWLTVLLWFGGVMISSFALAPLIMKYTKPEQKEPWQPAGDITRGLIDSVWMVLPHLDTRVHSIGPPVVWEQAWLDTTYFMQIVDPASHRYRTVILYNAEMYWKFKARKGEFIKLEHDSATVAENQAKWDADSIKYKDAVERMAKARNK